MQTNCKLFPKTSHMAPNNYKSDEDILLCRCYVAVTKDTEVGTDQTHEVFWSRIAEMYCEKTAGEQRTATALYSHYRTLETSVKLLVEIKLEVEAEDHSGWNEQMVFEHAKSLYNDRAKKKGGRLVKDVRVVQPAYEILKELKVIESLISAGREKDEKKEAPVKTERNGSRKRSSGSKSAEVEHTIELFVKQEERRAHERESRKRVRDIMAEMKLAKDVFEGEELDLELERLKLQLKKARKVVESQESN